MFCSLVISIELDIGLRTQRFGIIVDCAVSRFPGYEGYDYYSAQTSDSSVTAAYNYDAAAVATSTWNTSKTADMTMSANMGTGMPIANYNTGAVGSENINDSIIAKINQRLDMLSKESSGSAGEGVEDQGR